ncbi:uncharacterized protein LOC121381908 isoform X2 [Gigantopelta aegis]|nr:uncharacterized protein LOC121381908 isoform X2 [Gigantopelta aegis]
MRLAKTNAAMKLSRTVKIFDTDEAKHIFLDDVKSLYPPVNEQHVQNKDGDSPAQQSAGDAILSANENKIQNLIFKAFHPSNKYKKTTREGRRTDAENPPSHIMGSWRSLTPDIARMRRNIGFDIARMRRNIGFDTARMRRNIRFDIARMRRNIGFDMGDLANEEWELNYTTHSPELLNDSYPLHDFEVISQEEVLRAKHLYIKKVLMYVGITIASVFVFTVIAIFFITDPKSCILAFATGSPCCLVLSPCIVKGLSQFLNPGQVVRDQMNTYLPGMLIDRDGNIELYEITPGEIEAVQVMINDVIDFVA